MNSKSDTLLYVTSISGETQLKMADIRAKFVRLAQEIEGMGISRELSEAFTHIETAQMYAIKHLALVDPQGVKVPIV